MTNTYPLDRTYMGLHGPGLNVCAAPYNADPSGTSDSTNAIQTAFNTCPIGGLVNIPPGTYLTIGVSCPPGIRVNAGGAVIQHTGSGVLLTLPASVYDGPPTYWFGGTLQAGPNTTTVVSPTSPGGTAQGNLTLHALVIDGMGVAGVNGLVVGDNATGNTYKGIEVRNCATGVGNTNHAYSSLFDNCFVHANTNGVVWIGLGQNTTFRDCHINSNTSQQIQIGTAGGSVSGPIYFNGCEIEFGRASGAPINCNIYSCTLTIFHGCYFEAGTTTSGFDIIVQSSAHATPQLMVRDSYFNGNSEANYSIQIGSGVTGTVCHLEGNLSVNYLTAVVRDLGTSSQVRRTMCNENGVFVLDTYNGTAITWP